MNATMVATVLPASRAAYAKALKLSSSHVARLALSSILMGVLAACGGGGDDGPSGPTEGRLYPSAPGVVFSELDGYGRVLQLSSATDADGRFVFSRPLSSERIEARLAEPVPWRVTAVATARIDRAASAVVVSPLSAAAAALSAPGDSGATTRTRVKEWIGKACGDSAAAVVDEALAPARLGPQHSLPALWVEHAVAGYLGAMRDVGLGPDRAPSAWKQVMQEQAAVLSRMCSLSASLFSDAWIDERSRELAEELGGSAADLREAVLIHRTPVLDRILQMQSVLLARQVYPELSASLPAPVEVESAREADLASRLLRVRVAAAMQEPSGAKTEATSGIAALHRDLDANGRPVEALRTVGRAEARDGWSLRLRNSTDTVQEFGLDINGGMTMSMEQVVSEMLRLPTEAIEPLHVRAWRFISEQTRHAYPLSVGTYLHATALQVRSIGSGFCDDRASALHHLWQHLGYASRVWSLDGHVVAEVEMNGDWQMFDPDLGVYYRDRQGQVAGVAELAAEPDLVSTPILRLGSASPGAYDAVVAEIYGSSENNVVANWLSVHPDDQFPDRWVLPPGAELQFSPVETFELPSVVAGERLQTAAVRIVLPEGFSGRLPLPLLLGNVAGFGKVTALRSEFELAGTDLAGPLHNFLNRSGSESITELQVDRVDAGGLTLTLLMSPVRVRDAAAWDVRIESSSMSGMEVANSL